MHLINSEPIPQETYPTSIQLPTSPTAPCILPAQRQISSQPTISLLILPKALEIRW